MSTNAYSFEIDCPVCGTKFSVRCDHSPTVSAVAAALHDVHAKQHALAAEHGTPMVAPLGGLFAAGMRVCPDCGNKRCPKAVDHRNDCTRSNEPGQVGIRPTADAQTATTSARLAQDGPEPAEGRQVPGNGGEGL